jgi:hypothetical protein
LRIRFDLFTRKLPPMRERLWLTLFLGSLLVLASVGGGFLWLFVRFQEDIMRIAFKDPPVPPLTEALFRNRMVLLFLAAPWLLCAIRPIVRGTASIRVLIGFASTLIMVFLTTTIVVGVALNLPWGPHRTMSLWKMWHLDQTQVAFAMKAAERSDAEANYLLFQHYAFTSRQSELVEYYLARAAELGHPIAIKDLSERQKGRILPIPARSSGMNGVSDPGADVK